MKKTLSIIICALALIGGMTIAPEAHAQGPEVKQRMAARLPQIDAAKLKGTIGENNQGFLEARGNAGAEVQSIIDAENADRRVVYEAIAKSTGSTAEKVGRTRAAQIAERAASGVWLQRPSGEWYRK